MSDESGNPSNLSTELHALRAPTTRKVFVNLTSGRLRMTVANTPREDEAGARESRRAGAADG